MFDVESHCLVRMTVSVDAHTRLGRESQSPSGDAATKPTSSRGARGLGAVRQRDDRRRHARFASAGGLVTWGDDARLLR